MQCSGVLLDIGRRHGRPTHTRPTRPRPTASIISRLELRSTLPTTEILGTEIVERNHVSTVTADEDCRHVVESAVTLVRKVATNNQYTGTCTSTNTVYAMANDGDTKQPNK
jgi:hypothetical protein